MTKIAQKVAKWVLITGGIILAVLCAYFAWLTMQALALVGAVDNILEAFLLPIVGAAMFGSWAGLAVICGINAVLLFVLGARMRRHTLWWMLKWLLIIAGIEIIAWAVLDLVAMGGSFLLWDIVYIVVGTVLILIAFAAIGKRGRK